MSEKDEDKNTLDDLQKQMQNMFRQGPGSPKITFAMPGMQQAEPEEPVSEEQKADDEERLRRIREFNLKPKDIRDYLNRYVIRQDEAKKVLSVAICDHYNHVRRCLEKPAMLEREYSKQNILLLGPTGVGKTYLMRNIAKLIGVPFVKADATKFSETGYVGNDVEDLVRDLVKSAGGNIELAQYGIVYIDEIDKIAGAESGGKDVSGRGVQINLLKLMEDTEVNLFAPNDIMGQMQAMMGGGKKKKETINTRHILFIVSGAFDKLAESVKKRVDAASIGFASTPSTGDDDHNRYLSQAATPDFIKYGFEPEFIGRVPVRVSCESLSKDDLAKILTSSEGSLLRQYRSDFKGYDIQFDITPEAIMEIAGRAHEEKTGARGLMTVLEGIFRNFKFELPSTAIKSFEVTTETVAEPDKTLTELIVANKHLMDEVWKAELESFAKGFEGEHGITLKFTDEATDVLIELAGIADKTLRTICEEQFKDYQHGLKIIQRNINKSEFEIDAEAARDADKALSGWVVASFKEAEEREAKETATPSPSETTEGEADKKEND
ncbi:AAA family ATPase [Rubellicoccus peritrichatus]|uniref:AAA family ATPase n=1 Tax=Rubellicoccus peritrichatus TaxID=3080537 RepID=A0AAQ3QTJ2_9BACT|nr:AAA family ATPase [Puniceicoccus sp. CR14]WOO39453.1 AAA family ATPase [Puniceicoccus sp. CR14]